MNATYLGIIERFNRSYIKRDLKTLSERTQRAVAPYLTTQPCPLCKGTRLSQAALSCKINGRNIAELSAMEVGELIHAVRAIKEPAAAPMVKTLVERLQHLVDIGLDYLSLDRPTDTLSGGECQRIKLASELHKKGSIYVMDEPTTGLHMSDISHLLAVINRLVDAGNTVIVIEHNLNVVKNADWIIDMGPEGGAKGGQVIFTGTPGQLLAAQGSITAEYVRRDVV